MMALNNLNRRRPKRQRNPTTIYSDDRPNTFATKRWKGQIVYGPEQPPPPSVAASRTMDAPPSPSSIPINRRGPGRPPRKKSLEFPPPPKPTPVVSSLSHHNNGNKTASVSISSQTNGAAVVSLSSLGSRDNKTTDTPSPVKRKRGRPPKNRSKETADPEEVVISPSNRLVAKQKPPSGLAPSTLTTASVSSTIKTHTRSTPLPPPPPPPQSTVTTKTPKPPSSPFRRRRSVSHNGHSLLMRTPSWTPPQDDLEGTFLNHPVTLAPILPPILKHDNTAAAGAAGEDTTADDATWQALKAKYPAVFNEGGVPKACTSAVGPFSSSSQSFNSSLTSSSSTKNQQLNQASQLPSWTPLYTTPVYFEDDYDRETGYLDVDSIIPVTRKITALTVRKPHHDYLVLGDSAGFVLIYALDQMQRPIARLESVACQQRARPEQERLRAELQRKRAKKSPAAGTTTSGKASKTKGLALISSSNNNVASGPQSASSILMDTSDTTIHALGMIGERVVLATSIELECMDVPSATSLWVCPLNPNRFVTSLDMHLHTFDVLVSCSKNDPPTPTGAAQVQQPSSLMLLQHSKNNVEICDANSPMLVRSPSCTAIWDVGCDNRLMFVALSANRQELELVLVSGGSIEQWKVACKTKIPIKSTSASNALASSHTKLTQSPGGEYTLVASSRGIRLYQTESLQLIHVYGDQLSLHGQAVMWKDCWLAGSFFQQGKGCHKTRQSSAPWLEIDDWLAYTTSQQDESNKKEVKESTATDLPPYIVGVPHVKGPKELCESLHVWKVEHATAVPSLSIPLPHKGDGALGLAGGGGTFGEDRIVLVTNDGQGHALLPKMESNFAGIMYPPGYQIITDNIEFIEEEDALDDVVQYDDLSDAQGDSDDEDVNIFEQVEEEDMDEELKEAMRQSLLEHQRQEEARAAMEHEQDVDILIPAEALKKEASFLPCRPEPYLRQFIHTPEDEDDEEVEEEVAQAAKPGEEKATDDSANIEAPAEKEEVSMTAAFLSNVLEALPNMEKPQPVEDEDCLSFTTTKVVVAVNPVPAVPARPGRGKKARTGNLEAMLKASINPYLQSMMLGQQGVPADGSGSRLLKSTVASESSDGAQIPARDEAAPNDADTGHSTPDPKSTTADEAAVALGLLGLSPTPGSTPANQTDVMASVVPPTKPAAPNGHGPAYLSASSLSFLPVNPGAGGQGSVGNGMGGGTAESLTASSDRGSVTEDSVGDVPAKPKSHRPCKHCHACRGRHVIHTCGKRALPIDYDEVAKAEREKREKEEEEKKRQRAEKRRLADQRRREAKKQKQRELDEQRVREEEDERREKERQLRLQDDFASQDLNRHRRDQIVASYAQYQDQGSLEMNSVNYSQPQSTTTVTTTTTEGATPATGVFETMSRPQVSNTFEELSRPEVGSIFEQASRMLESTIATKPLSAGETAALYTKTAVAPVDATAYSAGAAAMAQRFSVPAPLTIPPAPAPPPANHLNNVSMASAAAQLEALDGLAALAELARVTPAAASRPDPPSSVAEAVTPFSYAVAASAPFTEESESNVASFSYAASHGFGSGEPKNGIPSYASIRSQSNGGTNHAPISGGIQQQTVETYVWPPHGEPQN